MPSGPIPLQPLAIAIASLLSAAPAQAEIRQAWCVVTWPDTNRERATGDCHFRQAFGNVQVWMGDRYAFDFPYDDQGHTYERQNAGDFIDFKRGGYILKVFQRGKPASE